MTCRARLYARRLTRAWLHVRALHVMRLPRTPRVGRVYDLHALPRRRRCRRRPGLAAVTAARRPYVAAAYTRYTSHDTPMNTSASNGLHT